jgi:putative endonuclease
MTSRPEAENNTSLRSRFSAAEAISSEMSKLPYFHNLYLFLNLKMQKSWVYIITNKNNTVLYTGVTSNLQKRMNEHKNKTHKGFATKYNCEKLVYIQEFSEINQAIEYEKRLKAGNRARKEKLINTQNPDWNDLSEEMTLG